MAKEKKIRVVTLNKAVEMLGVSRMTFYNKYKPHLEHMPSTDNKCYFREEDVLEMVKQNQSPSQKYKIIG